MTPPLKVGDRVRRRGEASKGTVSRIADPRRVFVRWDGYDSEFIVHNELLIRLRPVKRREWTLYGMPYGTIDVFGPEIPEGAQVTVREIRKERK